jgi:hypothetical protein
MTSIEKSQKHDDRSYGGSEVMKADESMATGLHEHGEDLIRYFLLWN